MSGRASESETATSDTAPGGSAPEATSPAPGQRFRGLLVHSLLGRGAMGEAHLASHSQLRTPVVLKTFARRDDDPIREAHLAARVRHPNVVDVLDAGHEDELSFITQRYIDGVDLGELVRRLEATGSRISPRRCARLLRDVARGLHAVHRSGVVHRDVKPQNIFLEGRGQALLGDFGIAGVRGPNVDEPGVRGTPIFMAPELWSGDDGTVQSDLYALGVTAHWMCTGASPFDGADVKALARQHLYEPYLPPRTKDPDLAYLFAVVDQLLEKDPDARPRTAAHVVDLLENIVEDPRPPERISPDEVRYGNLELVIVQGDLSTFEADVLVNAANWKLEMEVGVARALRDRGGREIEDAAKQFAPARMGDVIWTGSGSLQTQAIAHAVSAMAGAVCLGRCTLRALLEARSRNARTIAFPALGTGVGDVPHALAAQKMFEAVETVGTIDAGSLERVTVVLFDDEAQERWRQALAEL